MNETKYTRSTSTASIPCRICGNGTFYLTNGHAQCGTCYDRMLESTKVKTIIATKIPGLVEKYSNKEGIPDYEAMVQDIYTWGEMEKHQILDVVCFPTGVGFQIVVVYK